MKVKVALHIPVTQGSNNLTIQVTAPIDVLGLNSLWALFPTPFLLRFVVFTCLL
jgi:hypothetical protein